MTNIEQTEDLLRRLIEAFIFNPRDLHIEPKGVSSRMDFVCEVHPDDQRLAIGYRGSHIKALAVIVKLMGLADNADYRFVLVDRVPPAFIDRSEPTQAEHYDAEPARVLLFEILKYIFAETPKVEVAAIMQPKPLTFTFGIRVASGDDYVLLTKSPRPEQMTLEAALGTIYRAFANRDGVSFRICTL